MAVLAPTYPPPLPSNTKSIRFYATGTATGVFSGNEFAFERIDPADPAVPEQGWSYTIQITATTANIEFSFDGTNVHGIVLAGKTNQYQKRHEGGIAVRGSGTFYVEAW